MLGCSAGSAASADTALGSSSHPGQGLPSSPPPSSPQVLEHQQQHGLLVDPSLPCVPGHPGESPARSSASAHPFASTAALGRGQCWLPCPCRHPAGPSWAHSALLQINFFIFIRIIQILVSKLRAHQMRYTDYKFRWALGAAPAPHAVCARCTCWCVCACARAQPPTTALTLAPPSRLAKSTLTLIPLLGIHEVVFAFVTDEHAQGTLRYVKLFFDLFLSSFQVSPALPGPALGTLHAGRDRTRARAGDRLLTSHASLASAQGMLVAILYCFINKEVSSWAGSRQRGAWGAVGTGPG